MRRASSGAPARGPGAALLTAVAALAVTCSASLPARAAAAEVAISWDQDLAFEWDRASYERTLREWVARSDAEVAAWLGFSRTRPLRLRVMTKPRFEQAFGSVHAASAGAHYLRGEIAVNGGARLDGWFSGMLTHELCHAYLDDLGTGHRLPSWLNEGMAERLGLRTRGQETLTTGQRQELEIALQDHRLVPLAASSGRFKYLVGFAAVLFLEQKVGKDQLLAVIRRTLAQGTFEQALDAELRWTPKDLDERFSTWVDHLQ
jgi:hypothetical protein